jgi:hypothetical protein
MRFLNGRVFYRVEQVQKLLILGQGTRRLKKSGWVGVRVRVRVETIKGRMDSFFMLCFIY